ncbi:MAG TPA: hypothetical protein VLD86_10340 [Ilumatobacteraceae bacterium]|nr:hypothetical protein [Ilumatobacteraceae bacterium]
MDLELDLSDAYNRIADTWYPIFSSRSQQTMPVAACAYPINMGEHTIAAIRDDVQPEDYYLRWQMAMGSAEYHLYCNWQGRALQKGETRYLFIENAVGWVDWLGGDAPGQLDVQVAFGRPYFDNNVGTMLVDFYVTETDQGGAVSREVHRSFQIHADGRRQQLF